LRYNLSLSQITQVASPSNLGTMESLAYIAFSLSLRLYVSAMLPGDLRMGNAIAGLIEGPVLLHFFDKAGRSSSKRYSGLTCFVFCLLTDYIFTRCWQRLVVVVVLAGVGMLLCDVVYNMWQDPAYRCSRCRLKAKIWVSAMPRRRAPRSKTSLPLPVLPPNARMSVPEPSELVIGAALLPDMESSDDDLKHLRVLSVTPNERASSRSPALLAVDPCHLTTPPDNSELDAPNTTLSPHPLADDLDDLRLPLEPNVISGEPFGFNFQRIPTAPTALPLEAPDEAPLLEDPVGTINEQDERQTCTLEDAISQRPSPDAAPAVDLLPDQLQYNNTTSLTSTKASEDKWDDLESEVSPPSSVLSVSRKEDLISHADLIRQVAVEADQQCIRLVASRKQALEEGRVKEAFLLMHEIEEAKTMSRRLHERAERRYYRGA
jgi:hypothetical protein